ncbi:unnamed protein product [Fraxinus pennsylvanica]|uniref:Uncharacterized protein n=1 Tax=Fraxinus pennsylvanica TaxID=56036 RepID=A0AAD2E939_9LAMI|nr:unnamed protein product [Fraxinus pennsylvanica]
MDIVRMRMLILQCCCTRTFARTVLIQIVITVICDKGSYSTAMDALMEGKMEDALRLQAEMVGKRYQSDSETYGAFIDGHLKRGNETMAALLSSHFATKCKLLVEASYLGPNYFSG